MAALRIEQLVNAYGATRVLHGIDLDVANGEFVVLVGPSGCGKSTLLRMIAGLDDISSGEMWIGDRLANSLPPQQRNISMVFQSYALFPHMNVRGECRLRAAHPPRSQREHRRQGRQGRADAQSLRLSRPVPAPALGRPAPARRDGPHHRREPDLFLFDEPLSNLDAKLRVQMRTEIKALHQALKTTIVYVTHDQIEAMTMADRIVVMNAGRIEQIGAPLELYDRPGNRFVAGFLGSPSMSFIPGVLERGDGRGRGCARRTASRCPVGDTSARIGSARRDRHSAGALSSSARRDDGFPFKVEVVEPTGSETHVFGDDRGRRGALRLPRARRRNARRSLRLDVDPEHVHVFDADSALDCERGAVRRPARCPLNRSIRRAS